MNRSEIPLDLNQLTQIFADELGLGPSDCVYRYLHPVMICGIENGQLLLRGTRSNCTAIIDKYKSQQSPKRKHARSLEDPGLNFTTEFHPNYENPNRRLAISLRIKDQPKGLRIYEDVGSEARSVYFTLPEGTYFRADLKEGNPTEIGIAISIHQLMARLSINEEPEYLNWIDSGQGVRVVVYVEKPEKKEQRVEMVFSKFGNSYQVDIPEVGGKDKKLLELTGIFRLLLEDRTFDEVSGQDGLIYNRTDLIAHAASIPELKNLTGTP